MHLSRSFLIEGNDLQNLIEELLESTEEIIADCPDRRRGHIARARRLVTQAEKALNEFDLSNAYEHAVSAYKEAAQTDTSPVDKKRKAAYRKRAREVMDGCGICRFNLEMCGYTRSESHLVYWLEQGDEPPARRALRERLQAPPVAQEPDDAEGTDPLKVLDQRMDAVMEAIRRGPKDDERLVIARQLVNQATADLEARNIHSALFTITDAYDLVRGTLTPEAYREYKETKETAWRAADVVRSRTGVCPLCEENFRNAGWTTFHDEDGKHQTINREEPHGLARWHKHGTPLSVQ